MRENLVSEKREHMGSPPASVGVIGLGYVGLPLLLAFRRAGLRVTGVDIDPEKIRLLEAGETYLSHIPGEEISRVLASGSVLTTQMEALSEVEAVVIAVPTPLTDVMTPDLSFIEDTADALGPHVQPGQLISLESTTYPGTTREVLIPRLEEESGLRAGDDFFVAFSPERVDPGQADHDITEVPKLVSGLGAESLQRAVDLYSMIVPQVVPCSSLEIAETAKILENLYRAVNIALVNEVKVLADLMELDIWEIIDAAATKPFGFQAFYPGPGLGGHCLPIDPFYLNWRAKTKYGFEMRFVELAGKINTGMPSYVVERTRNALMHKNIPLIGAHILLLGMSYKRDISDIRESPGLELVSLFEDRERATVSFHDPFIPVIPQTRKFPQLAGRESVDLDTQVLEAADAVVISTDHSNVDYQLVGEHASLIVDTRNVMKGVAEVRAEIVKA
ncbi:nucleotide sugar dehydrogenase [Gemmatimonadota bacterium]